jgi:hypothetical protein
LTKKNTPRDAVEGVLKDIIGDLPEDPNPNSLPDPVGDAFHREQWGIDRPRDGNTPTSKAPAPLTRAQIAESLQNLSKTLNKPSFTSTAQLVAALAKAAESHLEEGNPVRSWLIAYAGGDKQTMRASIKKLVAQSRAEILAHVARGGHPLDLCVRGEKADLPN